jgi:hypothetical protein
LSLLSSRCSSAAFCSSACCEAIVAFSAFGKMVRCSAHESRCPAGILHMVH